MKRSLEFDMVACIGPSVDLPPRPPPVVVAQRSPPLPPSPPPERCPTPDPMDVLSPEQASLAMLLSAGALGDGHGPEVVGAPSAPPPLRMGVIQPDPHAGVFRDVGGVKKWMEGGCVMADC